MDTSVITARIRRMGEDNIFSLFTLAGRGGTPSQVWVVGEGYPIPGLGWGVPWPGLDGGYPIPGVGGTRPGLDGGGGYPHPTY